MKRKNKTTQIADWQDGLRKSLYADMKMLDLWLQRREFLFSKPRKGATNCFMRIYT